MKRPYFSAHKNQKSVLYFLTNKKSVTLRNVFFCRGRENIFEIVIANYSATK